MAKVRLLYHQDSALESQDQQDLLAASLRCPPNRILRPVHDTQLHQQHRCVPVIRDQPNSREKMHDFTAEFLKCVKFHGKFTERVSEIHGAHRRYFKVVC